jgi:DNA integrity scanning protein DisA with diadenylate cyclase activity
MPDESSVPGEDVLAAQLRMTRLSAEDPRRDPRLLDSVARVAPGTRLREGIEDIIRSHEGALIVIGDPQALSFLYSGGIPLDLQFTPQFLYELAKMDGAVVVNESISRLACANVQLMPDPTIPSSETGTRHRTAERVAKQTGVLVIAISQERETLTLFVDQHRYLLDRIPEVLARGNQALATLEAYQRRLGQQLARLTALELGGAVMLDDVLVVLQRAEMSVRVASEIERDCIELGSEGRLIKLQLEELVRDLPAQKRLLVHDYHAVGGARPARPPLLRRAGGVGVPAPAAGLPAPGESARSPRPAARLPRALERPAPSHHHRPQAGRRLRRPGRDRGGLRRGAAGDRGHRPDPCARDQGGAATAEGGGRRVDVPRRPTGRRRRPIRPGSPL